MLPGISGPFHSTFWDRLVLQTFHADEAVRHAVIAVASLDRSFRMDDSYKFPSGQTRGHYNFALEHYHKALKILSTRPLSSDPEFMQIAMISCVLFICFEVLQRNDQAALRHLESGLQVVRYWQTNDILPATKSTVLSAPNYRRLDNEFIHMFARLDVQASSFDIGRSPHPDIILGPGSSVPEVTLTNIRSLAEARDSLYCQMSCMYRFLRSKADEYKHEKAGWVPLEVVAEKNELLHQLKRWYSAFEKFLRSASGGMNSKELQAVILLKAHHKTMLIMLSTSLCAEEKAYDAYENEFRDIVCHGTSLVMNNRVSYCAGRKLMFSVEMGVIKPLSFTAARCRDPLIRRQALSLLYSHEYREGAWDGMIAAKTLGKIIPLEEQGLVVTKAADVPEFARVHQIVLTGDINYDSWSVRIELKRRLNGLDGGWDKNVDWISWDYARDNLKQEGFSEVEQRKQAIALMSVRAARQW
ncbi:MAG: hypothetical protein M1827_002164 [Pycnora praestabilis]|nr:MAG: hypothetical protein M1827_002164 [Pycnora praestabilis]